MANWSKVTELVDAEKRFTHDSIRLRIEESDKQPWATFLLEWLKTGNAHVSKEIARASAFAMGLADRIDWS